RRARGPAGRGRPFPLLHRRLRPVHARDPRLPWRAAGGAAAVAGGRRDRRRRGAGGAERRRLRLRRPGRLHRHLGPRAVDRLALTPQPPYGSTSTMITVALSPPPARLARATSSRQASSGVPRSATVRRRWATSASWP